MSEWEIEDLSVHMIHSRKLNIKAIVTFYAVVDELAVVELPVSAEDQEVSVKTEKIRLMSLRVHKKILCALRMILLLRQTDRM